MFRILSSAVLALSVAMPTASLADKPDHAGKGNGKGKGKPVAERNETVRKGDHRPVRVIVDRDTRDVRYRADVACPPGLAKKSPACIPPGQAKKRGSTVGDIVDWDTVHIITRPGLYGLNDPPAGQRYAIIDGRLVRVDRESNRILSILRLVDAILD